MSEEREVNPVMKMVLELGPTVVFFLLYQRMKDQTYVLFGTEYSGFIAATLIFVPILLLAMGALWWLSGKLSRIQVFTAIMVIFFGALTAYFNDERFFKMKTSIVYGLFAGLLGIGLLRKESWLEFIMADLIPMKPEGWMILTRRLCGAFAALAVANEIVWRTMSNDVWVTVETFGFPIALMAFLFWQMTALQSFMIDPEAEDGAES